MIHDPTTLRVGVYPYPTLPRDPRPAGYSMVDGVVFYQGSPKEPPRTVQVPSKISSETTMRKKYQNDSQNGAKMTSFWQLFATKNVAKIDSTFGRRKSHHQEPKWYHSLPSTTQFLLKFLRFLKVFLKIAVSTPSVSPDAPRCQNHPKMEPKSTRNGSKKQQKRIKKLR